VSTATSAGAVLAAGYWNTWSGAPTADPGAGKYLADDWAAPALLAISGTDADGYARQAGLTSVTPGDMLLELARDDSQDYQQFRVTGVTDYGTWVQLGVTVIATGSTFAPPGTNQPRLLEALRAVTVDTGQPWVPWAPPLDPPTTGGLPFDQAQAIADSCWEQSPHLCAALQWEAYAATLAPTPTVSQVATGAQTVAYDPASPTGEYGLALQRAAWHRSFIAAEAVSVPLRVAPPPGSADDPASWWEPVVP
jgi:hypothetical protein